MGWTAVTVAAFWLALRVQRWGGGHPLLNPVLLAVLAVRVLLRVIGAPIVEYAADTRALAWLLGPATVALAVPLWRHRAALRSVAGPVLLAVAVGVPAGVAATLGTARLLGADPVLLASLAGKSATAPVAMAVAEHFGGVAGIAALAAILTGILGAVIGPALLDALGVRDVRARGLAMGVAAHGIGTARALGMGGATASFAAAGMALMAVLVPLTLLFL